MSSRNQFGGIIHTYQKYDPISFPGLAASPPDFVSPAFDHLLEFGDLRNFTEEELANAVHLDISQLAGLGPSLESLRRMLEERKQKILSTYETESVVRKADLGFRNLADSMIPPAKFSRSFRKIVREEQIRELDRLWYRLGDERSRFSRQLVQLIDRLSDKYLIEELSGKYEFSGKKGLSIAESLDVKKELEAIDRLLDQLRQARETSQLAIIDLEELDRFAPGGMMDELKQIPDALSERADGIESIQFV